MSDLQKIFRGTFCGCPMAIKTKKQTNLSTNKPKNKQINIYRSYIYYPNQVRSSQNFEGYIPVGIPRRLK